MKKVIKIVASVIGILAALLLIMFIKEGKEVKGLEYYTVNLNEVEDGVYLGKAETSLVKVEVEVEVNNHKIVKIDLLKHDNGFGKKAERITEDMISMNTYEVDAVSGATTSSEVIKSAVSDALANGKSG